MAELTHIDLFSGIGGFALAARWNGIKTVQFVEIDKFCQKVLAKNFSGVPIHDDIKTFTYAETIKNDKRDRGIMADQERGGEGGNASPIFSNQSSPFLLTGGFPCQPFSCAGKRRGKEDDRFLWPEMLRVISEARPTWVIGENVAGFINMGLDDCISDLEREGYEVQAFVIPACAVNAPHRRDRVWIVAHSISDTERGAHGGNIGKCIRGRQESDKCQRNEMGSDITNSDCHAANTDTGQRLQRHENGTIGSGRETRQERGGCVVNVPNSEGERLEGSLKTDRKQGQKPHDEQLHGCCGEWNEPWLEVAQRLCRVDDGLPRELDGIMKKTDQRKCAKQETIAIIENGDDIFIGSNWCENPQKECPRKDMPTGVGYELCKDICGQKNHAEVDAIQKAGEKARGGTLYLIGHYYLCGHCKNAVELAGVKNIIMVKKNVDRVNRLKALGNAIVPQVAYEIMKAILQSEGRADG